jgi:hypothetical protein
MSTFVSRNEYDNVTTRLVCLDRFSDKCVDCYYYNNICYDCYNNRKQMTYFMNFREFKQNSINRIKRITFNIIQY